jgi:hypothetical protein
VQNDRALPQIPRVEGSQLCFSLLSEEYVGVDSEVSGPVDLLSSDLSVSGA